MAASIDDYRRKCWDAALHAYGTGYIFQKRARRLKRQNDLLTWVGFAVPLLVGALVGVFGHSKHWNVVLVTAAVIGAVQIAISLWSIIKGWADGLSYSVASAATNESLATRFAALGEEPPGLAALKAQYEKLSIEDAARRERDNEKGVTEKERRMGMRAALRKHRRACPACQKAPTTMKSSDCGVCGQF